jgi:hypothetical protein
MHVPHHHEEMKQAGMYDQSGVGGALAVPPEVDARARPTLRHNASTRFGTCGAGWQLRRRHLLK